MEQDHAWGGVQLAAERPELIQALYDAVAERGPVTLGELEHLGDDIKRGPATPGNMWNWSVAKKAVELLFWQGRSARCATPPRSDATTCSLSGWCRRSGWLSPRHRQTTPRRRR